jgi:hypothetical protein
VENGIHEVAGAVSGKGTAGAVGTVGARSESKDKKAGSRVSEAGNGAGPVSLILIGAAAGLPDSAAVIAQAGTAFAGDDGVINLLEEW